MGNEFFVTGNQITLEFAFECEECGNELKGEMEFRRGVYTAYIAPCEVCLEEAKEEGKDEAYDEIEEDEEDDEENKEDEEEEEGEHRHELKWGKRID